MQPVLNGKVQDHYCKQINIFKQTHGARVKMPARQQVPSQQFSGQHHVTGSIENVQPRWERLSDQPACVNTSALGLHMQ